MGSLQETSKAHRRHAKRQPPTTSRDSSDIQVRDQITPSLAPRANSRARLTPNRSTPGPRSNGARGQENTHALRAPVPLITLVADKWLPSAVISMSGALRSLIPPRRPLRSSCSRDNCPRRLTRHLFSRHSRCAPAAQLPTRSPFLTQTIFPPPTPLRLAQDGIASRAICPAGGTLYRPVRRLFAVHLDGCSANVRSRRRK